MAVTETSVVHGNTLNHSYYLVALLKTTTFVRVEQNLNITRSVIIFTPCHKLKRTRIQTLKVLTQVKNDSANM